MQILLTLSVRETSSEDRHSNGLLKLLQALKKEGYAIHSLFGNFVFDVAHREIIDVGEPGKDVKPTMQLVEAIEDGDAKLAVIFIKEKYIVFANSYFLARSFANGKEVRPLCITDILDHFNELIVHKDEGLLNDLYHQAFLRMQESISR